MNNSKILAIREQMQERTKLKHEAGSIATHFPEVAKIVMKMTYSQKGSNSILRTFYYNPSSSAFFMINCLRKDCVDGGFDLTKVVSAMIKNHTVETKGELTCKGTDSLTNHSDIVYKITIQYT
jgi:hypothetical protein